MGTTSCNARSKVSHEFIRVLFRSIPSPLSGSGLTYRVVTPAEYQTVTNARRQNDKRAAVSVSVELYINSAVCQPRAAEREHTGAAIYHSNQKTKSESPHDTVAPTRAVYQPRKAKKNVLRSCISTARCINFDPQSKIISGAAVHQQRSAVQTLSGTAVAANVCIEASQAVYRQ